MEAFCTMHTIENEELRVMISGHGAELSGIFDKKTIVRFSGMQTRNIGNATRRYFFRMSDVFIRTPA